MFPLPNHLHTEGGGDLFKALGRFDNRKGISPRQHQMKMLKMKPRGFSAKPRLPDILPKSLEYVLKRVIIIVMFGGVGGGGVHSPAEPAFSNISSLQCVFSKRPQ